MYLAHLLILAAIGVLLNSAWALVAVPILAFMLGTFIIPHEERRLRLAFGERYEAYARRVRRWL
jgi:protein-S-isoprenylcysteine O-methyltransferase Ste14